MGVIRHIKYFSWTKQVKRERFTQSARSSTALDPEWSAELSNSLGKRDVLTTKPLMIISNHKTNPRWVRSKIQNPTLFHQSVPRILGGQKLDKKKTVLKTDKSKGCNIWHYNTTDREETYRNGNIAKQNNMGYSGTQLG